MALPKWLTEIRGTVPGMPALALGLLPVLALIAVWWALTAGEVEERVMSPLILPSPVEVVGHIPTLASRRWDGGTTLFDQTLISLRRVGLGFAIALAVALPVGVLAGAFGAARAMVAPMMTASGYIPIAALVPLTMSWFGTGETQKIVFLALAFLIYLLPMVVKAIDGVPEVFVRTAYTLGASRWQVVGRVLVPIALPDIWHAMRLAFGVGWTYIVLTEAIAQSGGLGYVIESAKRRGWPEQTYLVIILITLIAWLCDLALGRLGRRLFPYRMRR